MMEPWLENASFAVTICDPEGWIVDMNLKAGEIFSKDGGRTLIGANLMDCHPEPARTKLKHMLAKQETNTYTIEKNGIRKLIHQVPWFEEGRYGGFIELVIEIPDEMPHFARSNS